MSEQALNIKVDENTLQRLSLHELLILNSMVRSELTNVSQEKHDEISRQLVARLQDLGGASITVEKLEPVPKTAPPVVEAFVGNPLTGKGVVDPHVVILTSYTGKPSLRVARWENRFIVQKVWSTRAGAVAAYQALPVEQHAREKVRDQLYFPEFVPYNPSVHDNLSCRPHAGKPAVKEVAVAA